jgi:hypothetical protein
LEASGETGMTNSELRTLFPDLPKATFQDQLRKRVEAGEIIKREGRYFPKFKEAKKRDLLFWLDNYKEAKKEKAKVFAAEQFRNLSVHRKVSDEIVLKNLIPLIKKEIENQSSTLGILLHALYFICEKATKKQSQKIAIKLPEQLSKGELIFSGKTPEIRRQAVELLRVLSEYDTDIKLTMVEVAKKLIGGKEFDPRLETAIYILRNSETSIRAKAREMLFELAASEDAKIEQKAKELMQYFSEV